MSVFNNVKSYLNRLAGLPMRAQDWKKENR
jgi:hypothetical protein